MSTPANYYVDIVFEAVPNRVAFESVMNGIDWNPWISPADIADPDDNRKVGFDEIRIVAKWINNTCYMRVTRRELDDLLSISRPKAFEVIHELDPFELPSFIDSENPTEAELNVNNIWWHISQDDAKVSSVRKVQSEQAPELDNGGEPTDQFVKQGLKFGAFDERKDFRGKNESVA